MHSSPISCAVVLHQSTMPSTHSLCGCPNSLFLSIISTSNVTKITEVQSARALLFAGTCRSLVSVITTLLCCDYFSSSSVLLHTFSALHVYSTFGHRPHQLGYLSTFVPNYVSFPTSIAEIAHGDNSCTQSLNNSLNHSPSLFDAPGTEVRGKPTISSFYCRLHM